MYLFNMVQHFTDGQYIISPCYTYQTELEWRAKYHQEMSYALASEDISGVDIVISDTHLYPMFSDHLVK